MPWHSLAKVGLREKWRKQSGGNLPPISFPEASSRECPSPGLWRATPSLILADEPTGLDSRTSRDVLNFLKQLNEEGNTIVMITHDNSIALEARRVVRIADGKITFDGDVKDYAANPLNWPY